MATKLERVERANADLQRQLRQKENELKRVSVRSSLEKDAKRLQTAEERLRSAYHELEDIEEELAATKDREGKLRYELDVLRNVINLRDHPELLRAADAEARCRRLEIESRSLRDELVAAEEKTSVYYESSLKASKEADTLRFKAVQLQEELDRSASYVRELLQEREDFVLEADTAGEAITRCKEDLRQQSAHVQSLTTSLQTRERENRALQTALDELAVDEQNARKTWAEGHKLYESEKHRRKDAEVERDQLRVQCRLLQDQVEDQKQKLQFFDRTTEAQKSENKQLRDQMAQWQRRANEIDAMGRRLSLAEADQLKQTETVQHLEAQVATMARTLSQKDTFIAELQSELESVREELAIQIEQTSVLSRNLVQRVEQESGERAKLQEMNEALQVELAAAKEAAVSLSAVVTHHRRLSQTAAATVLAAGGGGDRLQNALLQTAGASSVRQPTAATTSNDHHSPARVSSSSSSSTQAQRSNNNESDLAVSPPTPLPQAARMESASSMDGVRSSVMDRTKQLRSKLEHLAKGGL